MMTATEHTYIGEDLIDLRDILEAVNEPDHPDHWEACEVVRGFVHDGLAADLEDFERYAENEPTAIHARYFETYAQELAEDIGAVDSDAGWPGRHIDWTAAARELAYDYSTFDVRDNSTGVEHRYYVRAF